MTRLTAFACGLLPGAALAHGGHAPLSGAAHDSFHLGPLVIAALAAGIGFVLWSKRS